MIRTIALIMSVIAIASPGLPAAAHSCIVSANATSQKALEQLQRHDFKSASRTQERAATTLKACLNASGDYGVASRLRLGELWQYAGEYATLEWVAAGRLGKPHRAEALLMEAKRIYTKLRSIRNIDQTLFDEILLNDHAVNADLAQLSRP